MTPVPNQPVQFNREVDCHLLRGPFRLLAQNGDTTQFQLDITNCQGGPNVIYNGDFTRAGGNGEGWTITPSSAFLLQPYFGNILHRAGSSMGYISQDVVIADGLLFLFTFTINQTQGQCVVKIGDWSMVFNGAVSGTFSYWIIASNVTNVQLSMKGTSDVVWGQISAVPYNTNVIASLIDIADDSVTVAEIPYTIYNGFATFSLDWDAQGVPDGCYRIEVKDPCNCGRNGLVGLDLKTGMFGSAIYEYGSGIYAGYWIVDQSSWLIGNGTALYAGTAIPDTSSIRYRNSPLCVGTQYTVTFTLTGVTNAQVRVQVGSAYGTWRSANGTYTETITCTVSGGLAFIAQSTGASGVLYLSAVSIEAVGLKADYISEEFKFRETMDCTRLITICNDTNAFGMGFVGTHFSPNVRLCASLSDAAGFTSEVNSYVDSFGTDRVYWGTSFELMELDFGAPAYIHRFMRLAVIADHFFIDDDEYRVAASEYPTPSWEKIRDMRGVTLPVRKRTELTMNRRIDDVARGCGVNGQTLGATMKPDGNVLTGGTTPRPPISTTDGQEITLDG